MSFRAEPPFTHGQEARTGILLVNLGTPDEPTAPAVRRYLAEFLSDPRVVEIPPLVWWPILHGVILRTRPAKSAAKYASVWLPDGSPLAVWTRKQAVLLEGYLGERGHALQVRAAGVTRVLVLPMYPQYAAATTASVSDKVMQWTRDARWVPELRFVNDYHGDAGYVDALAQRVLAHWQANGRGERLVLSFHGLPRRSLMLGDPYHCQCHKTARLLGQQLGLKPDQMMVTFQSRFGKAQWLEPYTEPTLIALAQQGVRSVDVMCPGFVADCLETLEEINQEARTAFLAAGGTRFEYIACLNDQPSWLRALSGIAQRHMQGWDTQAADTPEARADKQAEQALQHDRALAIGAEH